MFDHSGSNGSAHATLFKDIIEEFYKNKSVSYVVQIEKIDNIFAKERIDFIDLLKIDTEGNELNVLLGAKKAIESNRIGMIQFEFNYTNIVSRSFLRDFYCLLKNYSFFRILRDGLYEIPYDVHNEIFLYQNIVALNQEKIHDYFQLIE